MIYKQNTMNLTKEQLEMLKDTPLGQLLLSLFDDVTIVNPSDKVEKTQKVEETMARWEFPLTKENYDFLAKSATEFNRCLMTARTIGLDVNIKDLSLVGSLFNMVYSLMRIFVDENFANRFVAGMCSDRLNPDYFKELYHDQIRNN